MVHEDAMMWEWAIIPAWFWYERRVMKYWTFHANWERRTLSAIGQFVAYHPCSWYNLRETARDRLCVRIPRSYEEFEVRQGFLYEQETVFSNKFGDFIEARNTGLWVVAYTERVLHVCDALLV